MPSVRRQQDTGFESYRPPIIAVPMMANAIGTAFLIPYVSLDPAPQFGQAEPRMIEQKFIRL